MPAESPAVLLARIARSVLENKYQQHWLIHSCQRFESFLNARDLSLGYQGVRVLWELGILRPTVVEQAPTKPAKEAGLAAVGDEHWVDIRPLPQALARHPAEDTVTRYAGAALYHPFQVWQAKLIFDRLSGIRVSVSAVLGPSATHQRLSRLVWRGNQNAVKRLLRDGTLLDSYRLLAVLLDIGPMSLPRVTGKIVGGVGEPVEEYWRWRSAHDPKRLLAEHQMGGEDFERWHRQLSLAAGLVDPLSSWFDLTQQVRIDERKPLQGAMLSPTGKVRLAQDLYLMAQVLRLYASEFLGADLPEEDVARWGPQAPAVRERIYGTPHVTRGSRDVRRRVARRYGLDSGIRVVWFVEGDAEVGFLDRYCERIGIGLNNRGILIQNLRGVGGLGGLKSQKLDRRLKEAHDEEQFAFLTVDDEGDARARLEALRTQRLTTAGFRIWNKATFETANFSNAELAAVISAHLDLPRKKRVTGKRLRVELQAGKTFEKAMAAILKGSGYNFHSGRDWGTRLADWAYERAAPKAVREEGDRRIVRDLLFLFRGANTSFLETVTRSRVGKDGRLVWD